METVLILKDRILLICGTCSSLRSKPLFYHCFVLSDVGMSVSGICPFWYAQVGFELTAVMLQTTAHSLLLLAGRRFLVFLFVISPPIHVGVGVVCMICL